MSKRWPNFLLLQLSRSLRIIRLLSAGRTSGVLEFRVHCKEFLDRLVFVILKNPAVSSSLAPGISCFCPEIMLEGDDRAVFRLFADLTGVLGSCGVLAADETKASVEQFNSYIVERRRQHDRSTLLLARFLMWCSIYYAILVSKLVIMFVAY